MTSQQIEAQVVKLPSFEAYSIAAADAVEAFSDTPKISNASSREDLEAGIRLIDARKALVEPRAYLKAEIATATQLPIPFRLGMLAALSRPLRKEEHPLVAAALIHIDSNKELPISDYNFAPKDPYRYAEIIGKAIVRTSRQVSKRKPTPLVRLSPGRMRSNLSLPTMPRYYLVNAGGFEVEEPTVNEEDSLPKISYRLPSLDCVEAYVEGMGTKFVASTAWHAPSNVSLPEISQLRSRNVGVRMHDEVVRLLFGKKAIEYATTQAIKRQAQQAAKTVGVQRRGRRTRRPRY